MKGNVMTDDIHNGDGLEPEDKKTRGRRKKEKQAKGEGGGFNLKQWLIDSYNGVFKIVIQPQLPTLRVLGFMLIGFLFGTFWAYEPASINFYDGAPHQMREEHQDQYVIGVAASALARLYDEAGITQLLERVDNPAERVQRLITERGGQTAAALEEIQYIAQTVEGRDAPSSGNLLTSILQFILGAGVFALLANVFALIWGLLLGGYVERARLGLKKRFVGESEADKQARETMEGERRRREIAKQMTEDSKTATVSELGVPLVNKPSVYFKGRPFDDSFAIENADDMFLGETGAATAKVIGDTGELAAVEVWLFDKDDVGKTYTKVFVTEYGFSDPVMMSDLQNRVDNPASDIGVLRTGSELTLESTNLVLKAKVAEAVMGSKPDLPPNSYVDNLTIQMQAWRKANQVSPATAPMTSIPPAPPAMPPSGGQRDLSDYEIDPLPPTYAPPPASYAPLPQQPPQSSGQRDLSDYQIDPLPPSQPPVSPIRYPEDDDDPFGGRADFNPSGN
jgi:hypothetical protein